MIPKIKDFPAELKLPVFFLSLYCIFGPFVNLAYHISKKGIGIENALRYYFGSEEEMIPPQSLVSFLEVMHFHTWAQLSVIFILSSLVALSSAGRKIKIFLILSLFISSIGHIFLPSLVRFVSQKLIYLLFLDTVFFSASIIFSAIILLKDVFSKKE
jgi:hypothetical protein